MPILELTEFSVLKQNRRTLLCLDHGESVIGVAMCDANWSIPIPLANINNKKFTTSAEEIFKIFDDKKADGIVIGLPLDMNGGENKKCQSIRQFGRNLTKLRDINICFFDERFSTTLAQQALDNADISWDKKQSLIDKVAASYILQSFLDRVS